MLTFENPPRPGALRTLTREEIAAELRSRPGEWAVVARPDRMARAEATAERIDSGAEYGDGFEATVRSAGSRASDVRVYARYNPPRRGRK